MTVENTSNKQDYTGDGVTTGPYTFNFQTLSSWIYVYVDGVIVSDTTYTLTVNGDQAASPGGEVTFDVAVVDQLSIIILRTAPLTQESDYVPYSAFPSSTVEGDFDKSTIINQQQQEEITRSIKISVDSNNNPTIPEGEALFYWRWAANGVDVEYVDLATSGAPTVSNLVTYETKGNSVMNELDDLNVIVSDNTDDIATNVTGIATNVTDIAAILFAMDPKLWPTVANGGLPNTDIDFSAGSIADSTGTTVLASIALTKKIDAGWTPGSGLGGLFTGSVAANTTYHLFIIHDPINDLTDAGFDITANAAARPIDYTDYRRIASVYTDGSSNIIGFIQNRDNFTLSAGMTTALDTTSPATTQTAIVMDVPLGIVVESIFSSTYRKGSQQQVVFGSAGVTMAAASLTNFSLSAGSGSTISTAEFRKFTDTSGNVNYRSSSSTADEFTVLNIGWVDNRG
jgi:hypothetical protein